ncbi:uncharacterized protein PODANS_3_2670 [Podospora anserina S mat+]|uniref:Podospora anserina S mat+ genomic DNA chromosome 3, supercontig 2 n=1 Tax=Podospora anserina (strain S / ATCC MYA-4624 / DSM 980 / FGSC 10383) TaxID=515849 RepID=B2AZR6_PODAN|nr:uncharacterized protein PODANS_3_2670 [Podospora anserina S mat+]CAP70166.1 unnamed protein product [Podospora anserina S mat+]CDP26758.1 Putative protein of unknown function [Podospora anserina S mat+]
MRRDLIFFPPSPLSLSLCTTPNTTSTTSNPSKTIILQPHQNIPSASSPNPLDALATLTMASQTPRPQLRKKASFRDRFKSWQKSAPPALEAIEEPKQKFVYEPKHAASDFSRMPVLPVGSQRHRIFDSRRTVPLQSLPEGTTRLKARRGSQSEGRRTDDAVNPPPQLALQHELARRDSKSKRYSYTLVEDPLRVSQTAAVHQVPISTRPMSWDQAPTELRQASHTPTRHHSHSQHTRQPRASPSTDFELFLAQAEAEERAHHEVVLRQMSQRAAAAQAAYPHRPTVHPNPHTQFASAVSDVSAATTAVGGRTSASGGSKNSSRRSRDATSTGTGNRSHSSFARPLPTEVSQQPLEQPPQRLRHKGHSRNPSWATGASVELTKLDTFAAETAPTVQPVQVLGVDEAFKPPHTQVDQPRTLRRQSSIAQKIAEYIRPSRQVDGGVGYQRSGSKRHSQAIPKVETLAE